MVYAFNNNRLNWYMWRTTRTECCFYQKTRRDRRNTIIISILFISSQKLALKLRVTENIVLEYNLNSIPNELDRW